MSGSQPKAVGFLESLTYVVEAGIENEFPIVQFHIDIGTSYGLSQIQTKQLYIIQQLFCSFFSLHDYLFYLYGLWLDVTHITELVPALVITLLQNIVYHLHHFLQARDDST